MHVLEDFDMRASSVDLRFVITVTMLIGSACDVLDGGGSDTKECSEHRWRCSSGECIWINQTCDGWKHCNDGSDETTNVCGENCKKVTYYDRQNREHVPGFACANGQCIPIRDQSIY